MEEQLNRKMEDFKLAYIGPIVGGVVIFVILCCFTCALIRQCSGTVKCGTGSGRQTNGARHHRHHARNRNLHSNQIYSINGHSGSYGGGFGGCDFGGGGGDLAAPAVEVVAAVVVIRAVLAFECN